MNWNYVDMNDRKILFGINEIKYLMASGVFSSTKSRGQNFLIDANIPRKIVEYSRVNSSHIAFEVGAGLGALTNELAMAAKHVVSVELDKRLVPILQDTFSKNENVSIIEGDILKIDIKKVLQDVADSEIHVCANLPYNITTPAIITLVESGIFKSMTLMVQKEVAERIVAAPGTSDYGAFSVFSQYHSIPEILFHVSPECFYPRPSITSSVLKMSLREKKLLSGDDEKLFFRVVKGAFSQRRKTLVNALHASFSATHSKENIAEAVCKLGRGEKIRGEALGIDEFMKLCELL